MSSAGSGIQEGPLLERERELSSLAEMLERARGGRGGVALVEAEAGMGKSRLLLAARGMAEAAGMHVLAARGSELERSFAFGVARQLLGEPSTMTTPDQGEFTLSEAGADGTALAMIRALHQVLLSLIWDGEGTAQGTPILVLVDDAQWVDEPTLRFLAHMTVRIDDHPIAMVAAVRTSEAGAPEELLHRLRESPSARVLAPTALSENAVGMVVGGALGEGIDPTLAAACFRATGGNPFYLHELLRALEAEAGPVRSQRVSEVAPRAVLRSIVVRLARLGEDASRLAKAVAVLGDAASLGRTAALAELAEPAAEVAADTLAAARILEHGDPLRFRHPLIASTLEADMGAFERARKHRRAGDMLLEEGAPLERVAAHFLLARPEGDRRVAAVLGEAAARAAASGSPSAAARLLERALQEPPAPEDESELLLASARTELLAGSPAAASRLEQALVRIEVPDRRADALVELATLAHHRGDYLRAAGLAARARAELPDTSERQQQLLGIELAAMTLHPDLIADVPARLEPILAGARAGEPPADSRLLALVIAWMAIAEPPSLVRSLAKTAIAIDPLIDDSHGTSLGWIAAALGWVDELELAERWLDDAVAAAEHRGAVIPGAIASLQRATVRHHLGRLDAAVVDSEEALEIYRYGWTDSPWSTPMLTMSHVALGKLEAARAVIAIGRNAGSDRPDYAMLLEGEARLHLAEGNPSAALVSAQAVADHVERRYGNVQPRLWSWRRLAALAAHELGDHDQAHDLIDFDLGALRAIGPGRQLGESLTVAGIVAGGREGLDLLHEAAAVLESSPARLQRAETLLALGGALRRAGRRTAAQEPLYAALELAAGMGALPLEERARDELVRLGLRPRRAARSGIASLTPSERRVAELAADGLTNPQIGRRLHVTPNTVQTHLGHVYSKLALHGRSGLREALAGSP
jgi:DNA-binding CsgD family transcriptional regulator